MPGSNGNGLRPEEEHVLGMSNTEDVSSVNDGKKSLTAWLGLATAFGGMAGNIWMNARNNRYNREQNEQAYQRNLQMWNLQNAYNLPANQIERLRQAGLNPNLIYGNPDNTAGAPPEKQGAKGERGELDPMAIANAMLMQKQMEQIESQKEVNSATARDLNATSAGKEIDNKMKQFDLDHKQQDYDMKVKFFNQQMEESKSIVSEHIANASEAMSRVKLNENQLDEAKKTFNKRLDILEKEFEKIVSELSVDEELKKYYRAYATQAIKMARTEEFFHKYYEMYQDPNIGAFDKEGRPISYMQADMHNDFVHKDISLDWFSEEYSTFMQTLPGLRQYAINESNLAPSWWRRIMKECDIALSSTVGNIFSGGAVHRFGNNPLPNTGNYGSKIRTFKPKIGFGR